MAEEKQQERKKLKYEQYFDEFCIENEEDIITVCDIASKSLENKFGNRIADPKIIAIIFNSCYYSILNLLKENEKTHSEFAVNVANRLEIKFTTTDDEDDEKQGNFMVSITPIKSDKKEDVVSEGDTVVSRYAIWNIVNTSDTKDYSDLIKAGAMKILEEKMGIHCDTDEIIIPLFILTYEALVEYIKLRRKEMDSFEYEVNFIGCFYIGARETDDVDDVIYIRPNIDSKLTLKNDEDASAKNE